MISVSKKAPVNYIMADAILNDEILIYQGNLYAADGEPIGTVELEEAINQRLLEDSEEDYSD